MWVGPPHRISVYLKSPVPFFYSEACTTYSEEEWEHNFLKANTTKKLENQEVMCAIVFARPGGTDGLVRWQFLGIFLLFEWHVVISQTISLVSQERLSPGVGTSVFIVYNHTI